MTFYGKGNNKKSLNTAGLVVGIIALIAGVRQLLNGGGVMLLLVALGLLVLVMYRNNVEITEKGYDDVTKIVGIKRHSLWKWEDINMVFADFRKAEPDVVLTVRKGYATRKVVMEPDCVQQIFDWAAEKNESVKFQYNGDRDFDVKGRHRMSEEEYEQFRRGKNEKPQNFHEMADIARQTKREILLRKPDPKKLKVKKNKKTLKGTK